MATLDIDDLRALTLLSDLGSFTRAAEALGATQSAVSLRLKRLEEKLGRRLVERTPRLVQFTPDGITLLAHGRSILLAHDAALTALDNQPLPPLAIGISDHVMGDRLPEVLARLTAVLPQLRISIRIGLSRDLLVQFEAGAFDAILLRAENSRPRAADGEPLLADGLAWFAAPTFTWSAGEPLPLLALAAPCGIRAAAVKALEKKRVPWVESFTGGGVMAVAAAASAGLGVAALGRTLAPPGTRDVTQRFGLPPLPASAILLRSHVSDPRLARPLREFAAAVKHVLRGR
ncbi:MAG: LysR family transcriptional regulator [Pseudomonadota bacterium]